MSDLIDAVMRFFGREGTDELNDEGNPMLISDTQAERLCTQVVKACDMGVLPMDEESAAWALMQEANDVFVRYGIFSLIMRGEVLPMWDGEWTFITEEEATRITEG